jgi:hypothetical protein
MRYHRFNDSHSRTVGAAAQRRRVRGKRRRLALALLAVAVVASCGHGDDDDAPKGAPRLYSPNGEPLNGGPLGFPSCETAMGRWFDRTDRDHDGTIDGAEFLADARRQFALMDLDKDGILTPAELAAYRLPYESEPVAPPSDKKRRREGRAYNDQPDPVMLADLGLHNQVTLADFLAYARRQFADLDRDRDGHIEKAEAMRLCAKPESS